MFENLFAHRGLSLERLRAFLEVAEAGSIVRAVRNDPVRQSQYSRQIGELETFFGVELFQRRGKTLGMTAAGRQLAEAARAQLAGLDDFLSAAQGQPSRFSIGAGDSLLQWVILPKMAKFQALVPKTRIELQNLRSSEIATRLADLRLDFGLARAGVLGAPLKHVPVGEVRYALFIPQKMLAGRRTWSEQALAGELPWVTLGSDGEFMRQVEEGAGRRGFKINFRLITESFPQAARAVQTGNYAAILPRHAEVDFAKAGVKIMDAGFLDKAGRKVHLAWNPKLLRLRQGSEQALAALRELLVIGS
jgi:DNA-binding transcriptional LysR family regulator